MKGVRRLLMLLLCFTTTMVLLSLMTARMTAPQ